MTNEIAVRRHGFGLTSDEFETMQRMARAMVASNYFSDVKDVAQAIVKIQAGSELGIPPFAALTGIHIIKNKPVLGANLIATLIKSDSRYDYRVATLNDEACVIEFYEDDEPVGESKFTMSDAKQAGIIKDNWNKYPRNMLFARAISNGARWYTPGIFSGATVYTPEEMGADVDEEGRVIDVRPEQGSQGEELVDEFAHERTNGQEEVPAEQGEFDEIDEPSGDTRAAASPQAQAKRERPKAEPETDPAGARKAEDARAALQEAAQNGDEPASDKQLKYVRSSMSSLMENDYGKAKLLLVYLFGIDSSSELTKGQASTLIDWIGANSSNDYTPTEAAQLEAYRMLKAFEIERGQGQLALDDAEAETEAA